MAVRPSIARMFVEKTFRFLAKLYVSVSRPQVVAVAGSVGKTSAKLMLAQLLRQQKRISYMDDSYNSGLGLYLSVFMLKVPTTKLGWPITILKALGRFLQLRPEILILEYGIDRPGEMEELIDFICPDVAMLTAVAPEHMEYLIDLETVAEEETKILKAVRNFGLVNGADVDSHYTKDIVKEIYVYGLKNSASRYEIKEWTASGAVVDFWVEGNEFKDIRVGFVSEPLIRQLTGVALLAYKLGLAREHIISGLQSAEPAAGRMRILKGKKGSIVIDDTANFSPGAGIEALKSLKRMPAARRIAILGNMHELGDYESVGFSDVAQEFNGVDVLILVGDLAEEYFSPLAVKQGFKKNETLFLYDDAILAGKFAESLIKDKDAILVKGPFGGLYMEEATKQLLHDPSDKKLLTRQSEFWIRKKRKFFNDSSLS